RATEDFDRGTTLPVGPHAGDPDPLTRRLIADIASVHRHIAGLPAHLHRALALIVERHEQVVFLTAPQHARIPAPVEHDVLQGLRTLRRRVRRCASSAATTLPLALAGPRLSPWARSGAGRLRTRDGRHADGQCGRECDAGPRKTSLEGHEHLPMSSSRWLSVFEGFDTVAPRQVREQRWKYVPIMPNSCGVHPRSQKPAR